MEVERPRIKVGQGNCPLYQRDMSEVCHNCAWFTQVRGKHPQTNEDVDQWQCAITWLPILLINNAQASHQTGAAVESFRNEMVKLNGVDPTRRLT
jgi:hypothetical protein